MSTIPKAAASTTTVHDHAEAVGRFATQLQLLHCERLWCLYRSSNRHSNLLEARKAIDAALAVMGTTTWPIEAEYERDEQA
jgi:hypothetical protein